MFSSITSGVVSEYVKQRCTNPYDQRIIPVSYIIIKFLAVSLNTLIVSTEVSGVISQPAETIQRLPESLKSVVTDLIIAYGEPA